MKAAEAASNCSSLIATKYKTCVVSLSGVVIAVTEARAMSLDVCVQLNRAAAELFAPDVAPLNAPAATSIVVAPVTGVNVAVYVVPVVEDLIPLNRYSSIGNLYV